jgi:hypothetical protein
VDTGWRCAVENDGVRSAAPNFLESHDIQISLEPSEASTRRFNFFKNFSCLGSFSRKEMENMPRDVHGILHAVPWKYLRTRAIIIRQYQAVK